MSVDFNDAASMIAEKLRDVTSQRDHLVHALGLTIDQRDRAVRALWTCIFEERITREAVRLCNEDWVEAVLDDER